jgi:ABC transporter transmembrane region
VNEKVKDKKEEKDKQKLMVPYSKILLTYADRSDKILITCGFLTAIITGLGLPSFVFLFGDIVNSFGPNTTDVVGAIRPISIDMTIIGCAIWITTYIYYTMLVTVSERLGKKTRVAYLRAIL